MATPEVAAALLDDLIALCRGAPRDADDFSEAANIGRGLARMPGMVAGDNGAEVEALAAADNACSRAIAGARRITAKAERDRKARGR